MENIKTILKNKSTIAIYIIVGLLVIGEIVAPGFLSYSSLVNILTIGAYLGIIVVGQTFVILSGNEGIDLSVGAIMSFGVVMSSQIVDGKDENMPMAFLLIVVVGLILGAINGFGVAFLKIRPLIMTLSMASVVSGISLVYSGGMAKGNASPMLVEIGIGKSLGLPNVFFIWVIITVIVCIVLANTKWGVKLYGTGSNKLTAKLSGTKIEWSYMMAYMISGLMAMICGYIYLGYIKQPTYNLADMYLMPSITAAVIGGVSLTGGTGNYFGAALGAIVFISLQSMLFALRTGAAEREIIFGIVLLVLLTIYARRKVKKTV